MNLVAVAAPPPPRGKHASGVRLRERAFGGRHAAASAAAKGASELPQEPKPRAKPESPQEPKPEHSQGPKPGRVDAQEPKSQPAPGVSSGYAVEPEAGSAAVSVAAPGAGTPMAKSGSGETSAKPPQGPPTGETSASIDARLEALVRERLAQMREGAASGEREPDEAEAVSPSDDLLENLARMLALDDQEARPPGGDVAKTQGSEVEQPSPGGKREPSSADKLDSVMFEEPPANIKEVMLEAEGLHRRGLAIKVGAVAASGALALGLVAFAFMHLPDSGGGDALPEIEAAQPTGDDAQNVASGSEKPDQEPKSTADNVDRSGEVVYRYALKGSDGETRSVTETVAFGKDGMCETSSLEVELPDEAIAQTYLADLERDFGSALEKGEADGAVVRAVVDVSSNGLDREGYEDALRVSVDDLAIVKKT